MGLEIVTRCLEIGSMREARFTVVLSLHQVFYIQFDGYPQEEASPGLMDGIQGENGNGIARSMKEMSLKLSVFS